MTGNDWKTDGLNNAQAEPDDGCVKTGVTIFTLQVVAMASMLCDHMGYSIFGNPLWMRCVGRFAFPLYAFMLAEGFRHMKNDRERLLKHLGGLTVLALVSELPYDLMECSEYTVENFFSTQNAVITLLLAFLGLMAIETWKDKPLYRWSAIALTALANYFSASNYKLVGVLLVYAFYRYLEKNLDKAYFIRLASILGIFIVYIPLYHLARKGFALAAFSFNDWCWYGTHILVAWLLAGYLGKLGYRNQTFKTAYRLFYPAHMVFVCILKFLVMLAA